MTVEYKTGQSLSHIIGQEQHVAFPMCTTGTVLNGVGHLVRDRWPDMIHINSQLGEGHRRRVRAAKVYYGLVCFAPNGGSRTNWKGAHTYMVRALNSLDLPAGIVIGLQLPQPASRIACTGFDLRLTLKALGEWAGSERQLHVYGAD